MYMEPNEPSNIVLIKQYRADNPGSTLAEAKFAVVDKKLRPSDWAWIVKRPVKEACSTLSAGNAEYRDKMDFPMETLAITLDKLGYDKERVDDCDLIKVATKKLQMMYDMLLASGFSEGLLKACIKN